MEIPSGYTLVDTLGEGSLATVYLAVEELNEREVALKLVKPEICSDPVFTKSFLCRARQLSELEHPHVVNVFDAGQVAEGCYLAMAYIAGRTLRHRRFELTLSEQLAVVKDVADALDYAHSRGCNHGRLTLDNILLRDSDHRVVVTDFVMGGAPVTAAEQRYYLSPEQRQGQGCDHRSDLYSLGVVLLLLIGGQLLREKSEAESHSDTSTGAAGDDPANLAQESAEWILPEGLSVFQAIVDQALAHSPADRFQSGAELIAELNEITEVQLERAAHAGALALLSEGEVGGHSEGVVIGSHAAPAAMKSSSANWPVNNSRNPVPVSEVAEREPAAEIESSSASEHFPGNGETLERLPEPAPELDEPEFQSGVLRVWEQDRIDLPFESQPPSWWLIASYGLAALALVGGVLLAALLD